MVRKRSLGDNIRIAREYNGLNQTELAAKVNVSRSYIANIEAGRKQPTVILMRELKIALNTTYDFLYDGHNPDNNSDKTGQKSASSKS